MIAKGPKRSAESEQVDRILHSQVFRGSDSLCRLLRYLADNAVLHPGTSVKEFQIATEVFDRKDSFDPRMDSSIRVQVARLRSKLLDYYQQEGAGDTLVIQIPKGAYMVTFVHREPVVEIVEKEPSVVSARWRFAAVVLGSLLAVSVAANWRQIASTSESSSSTAPLRGFWKTFLGTPDDAWVVFSNAAFVGDAGTGLRYFHPETDSSDKVVDHYTGVGEVLGIHELDSLFGLLHHGVRVKRGRLLSLDDVKNNNLIFVGSPVENLPVGEVPTARAFGFQRVTSGTSRPHPVIVNRHPLAGELPVYDPGSGLPVTNDYFLVALEPGINPPHWILLLAGTNTLGTQAAVEYVCHAKTVSTLLHRLGRTELNQPFEAVLQARITRGVPVDSQIVAVRASQ